MHGTSRTRNLRRFLRDHPVRLLRRLLPTVVLPRGRPLRTAWGLCILIAAASLTGGRAFSAEPVPHELPRTGAEFPPELLTSVKDFTNGFGGAEREVYYMVLAHARSTPRELQLRGAREARAVAEGAFRAERKHARRKFQPFIDVVTHPDVWRGQPVTLRGYIRDLTPMEAGENTYGLGTLYQANLFTEDSAQLPWVIVCADVPRDLPRPTPRRPTDNVTVTGYFFKLWTYRAETESGRWSAPVLLASRMDWEPVPKGPSLSPEWLSIPAVLAAGGIVAALWLRRQNQAARAKLRQLQAEPAPCEPEIRETLRDLERN